MAERSTPSEKIFEILELKGMKQSELAKRTGIPTSTISDWKRKGNIPTADKIILVCEALHVQPEDILGRECSAEECRRVILREDPLWEFITQYDKLKEEQKKRLLTYAMAMLKAEQ